jgi:hypothetical protein
MLNFIKPLPVIITLMTTTGILMHDMHIDKATTVAMSLPSTMASTGTSAGYEKIISQNYHTHVERASIPRVHTSFRSSLPNIQPPRDDDRRYIQNKKLLFMGGGDAQSLWPSV